MEFGGQNSGKGEGRYRNSPARVINSFLSFRGRIPRLTFWLSVCFLWGAFFVFFVVLETVVGRTSTFLLYPPFFWALFAVSTKRYHDLGKSAVWLSLLLIPLIGIAWVVIELGFRRGTRGGNAYGEELLTSDLDYLSVK